jgi:hypothetical protein
VNCAEFENETAHLVSPYSCNDLATKHVSEIRGSWSSRLRYRLPCHVCPRTLYILTRRIWGNSGVGGRIEQGLAFVVIKRATYTRRLEDKARVNSCAATIIIKEGPMIEHSGTISRRRLLLSQERGFIVARASKSNPGFFFFWSGFRQSR